MQFGPDRDERAAARCDGKREVSLSDRARQAAVVFVARASEAQPGNLR